MQSNLLKSDLTNENLVTFTLAINHVIFTQKLQTATTKLASIEKTLVNETLSKAQKEIATISKTALVSDIADLTKNIADTKPMYDLVYANMIDKRAKGSNKEKAVKFYLNMLALDETRNFSAIESLVSKDDTVMLALAKLCSITDNSIGENGSITTSDADAMALRVALNKVSKDLKLSHATMFTNKMDNSLEFSAQDVVKLQMLYVKNIKNVFKGKSLEKTYVKTDIVTSTPQDVQRYLITMLVEKYQTVKASKSEETPVTTDTPKKSKRNKVNKETPVVENIA